MYRANASRLHYGVAASSIRRKSRKYFERFRNLRWENGNLCEGGARLVVFSGGIEFLPSIPYRRSRIDNSGRSENQFQLLDLGGEAGLRGLEQDIDLRVHGFDKTNLQSGVRKLGVLDCEHEALPFADVTRQTRDRAGFLR